MTPEAQAIFREWSPPIEVNVILCAMAIVYARGWIHLHSRFPKLVSFWHLTAFMSGIASLWIAVGSPLEAFDDVSLSLHMVQHLLLMAIAPPLVLLGAPTLPLLRGLPKTIVRKIVSPFLRWTPIEWLGNFLTHPAVCWLVAALVLLGWHIPAAFELALRSNSWHDMEHICFFSASLLFWWPVIQPFPSVSRWPRWSIPVYLFLGMFPGGALGAFLAFCDRVLYPSYESAPRISHLSPLEDQVLAGVLMWVLGTIVCLVPAVLITVRLLSPSLGADSDVNSHLHAVRDIGVAENSRMGI
jgi:putative membrane protein